MFSNLWTDLSVHLFWCVCVTFSACIQNVHYANINAHALYDVDMCMCTCLTACKVCHMAYAQCNHANIILYCRYMFFSVNLENRSIHPTYLDMFLPCGSPAPVWSQSRFPACTCSSSFSSAWSSPPCPYLSTETGDSQMGADAERKAWWRDILLWWETSFCWAMSHELWKERSNGKKLNGRLS